MTGRGHRPIKNYPIRVGRSRMKIVPITKPGVYNCPHCIIPNEFYPNGRIGTARQMFDSPEPQVVTYNAGGHLYRWTSYVGWYQCDVCGYCWSENFS